MGIVYNILYHNMAKSKTTEKKTAESKPYDRTKNLEA